MDAVFSARIEKKLADPAPILRRIGATMLAYSQAAFRTHSYGSDKWEARYPNQKDDGLPYAHIAGIVSDLAKGSNPPSRRFTDQDKPLWESGNLFSSLSHRIVDGNAVELGSALPYASKQQFGGDSSYSMTPSMKLRLFAFLTGKNVKQGFIQVGKGKKKLFFAAKGIRRRLDYLFGDDMSETDNFEQGIVARPFLGINPELAEKVRAVVVKELGGGRAEVA